MRSRLPTPTGWLTHPGRLGLLIAALLAAGWLFQDRYRLVLCVGESMYPTLGNPALLLVDCRAYREAAPARNDIVVARHLGQWITKRVVGLPEETVAVVAGRVLVDGQPPPGQHPVLPGGLEIGPGHLQPGRYALLGDNRSLSVVEQVHAVVPREALLGRVAAAISREPRAPAASSSATTTPRPLPPLDHGLATR